MSQLFDRIRAAWQTGQPMDLHRAAEQLAEQGHAESDIYNALERLLLQEREGGADDEMEDRITSVMDRLTGWTHESNHINSKRIEVALPQLATPRGVKPEVPSDDAPASP